MLTNPRAHSDQTEDEFFDEESGNTKPAAEVADDVKSQANDQVEASLEQQAEALAEAGQYDEATEAFKKALAFEPHRIELSMSAATVLYNDGILNRNIKKVLDAEKMARDAAGKNSSAGGDPYLLLGTILEATNRNKEVGVPIASMSPGLKRIKFLSGQDHV